MEDFHPNDYAAVVKPAPGGWNELASGTVGELLVDLADGKHGRPGALGLLIDGQDTPIFGRALSGLIASHCGS
jgi:hypothetical protein